MPELPDTFNYATDRRPAGDRRRRRLVVGSLLFVAVAASIGGYVLFWRSQLKRLQITAPGIFYRVGQTSEFGLRYLVEHYGVRTVVNLQIGDFRLHRGWFDPGNPDGERESVFVRRLGAQYVQWPMGDEHCWPWPRPWEVEDFFRLLDDPANRPVVVHCQGGRHRTGTFGALYRLEYDRWTPRAALQEMHDFDFGSTVPAQEHNLRTYVPRPLPNQAERQELAKVFGTPFGGTSWEMIEAAARIRAASPTDPLRKSFVDYVACDKPFALPLASRVLVDPADPAVDAAVALAVQKLKSPVSDERTMVAAAALVADFGRPEEQRMLVELLTRESRSPAPTPLYESLVRGVTNRYTPNRIAFLRPLLEDRRRRFGGDVESYTYATSATVRLASITGDLPIFLWDDARLTSEGPALAGRWLAEHPAAAEFSRLRPALGSRVAAAATGEAVEDPNKMRRR